MYYFMNFQISVTIWWSRRAIRDFVPVQQGGSSELFLDNFKLYEDTTPGWELVSIKASVWAGARSEACLLLLVLMHFTNTALSITSERFGGHLSSENHLVPSASGSRRNSKLSFM